ncbi:hypothetical protein SDC9_176845 [bioreactor metagenome]|uniref:Uncharacterized protein n=1 Tax=bioreactor metagenome TaxID=1076179 RepID=A0A645GTU3_9ZZZZ
MGRTPVALRACFEIVAVPIVGPWRYIPVGRHSLLAIVKPRRRSSPLKIIPSLRRELGKYITSGPPVDFHGAGIDRALRIGKVVRGKHPGIRPGIHIGSGPGFVCFINIIRSFSLSYI